MSYSSICLNISRHDHKSSQSIDVLDQKNLSCQWDLPTRVTQVALSAWIQDHRDDQAFKTGDGQQIIFYAVKQFSECLIYDLDVFKCHSRAHSFP